jgi:hypothetical protein
MDSCSWRSVQQNDELRMHEALTAVLVATGYHPESQVQSYNTRMQDAGRVFRKPH